MRRSVLCCALLAMATTSMGAQEVIGPAAGTWGAETGGLGGATLLRFRSTTSAWLAGFTATVRDVKVEDSGTGTLSVPSFSTISLRVGVRKYRNENQAFRPFHTVALLASLTDLNDPEWGGGAAFELGAVHFFSRHLSVGASGEVNAQYTVRKTDFLGDTQTIKTILVQASAVRVLAGIYF